MSELVSATGLVKAECMILGGSYNKCRFVVKFHVCRDIQINSTHQIIEQSFEIKVDLGGKNHVWCWDLKKVVRRT